MEIFEGKQGKKVYKRKKDAEFVAERSSKVSDNNLKILKVLVLNQEEAQRMGVSIHPDISIAARKPEEGEKGWIVVKSSDKIGENYNRSLEILSENSIS